MMPLVRHHLSGQFLLEGVEWIEESGGDWTVQCLVTLEALGEHCDRGPGPAVCMRGSDQTLLKDH